MQGHFYYNELELLTKIFSEVDISKFTEEEKSVFNTLSNQVKNEKENIDNKRLYIKEIQDDFNRQIETNNFKWLCGACSDTCSPRCLGLYNRKYCNGMSSCKSMIENPDYKKTN